MATYELHNLGEFRLESGVVLGGAQVAYKTYGTLNSQRTNAVQLCSFINGLPEGYEWLIGVGRCLDPQRLFIISTTLFGSGFSSSPDNTSSPFDGPRFPLVTIRDNVRAQRQLITEKFGISRLVLVAGFSMGAQQAFQWAVSYPDMVERVAAWCGHAHTTSYTRVWLDGRTSVLKAAVHWNGVHYSTPSVEGARAMARSYAAWGMSPAWYREQLWTQLGFSTLEEFMVGWWEKSSLGRDINNVLAQLETWKSHNVGDTPGFNGDYRTALASISARVLTMPCRTDLYIPLEDAEEETRCLRHGLWRPIESIWGHWAGSGINESDRRFIDTAIEDLLADKER